MAYKSSYGNERVYGVNEQYNKTNSCYFTAYSRKTFLEDAAETISIGATFASTVEPLDSETNLRKKLRYLSSKFQREYETLSPFITGKVLFADRRLA